MATPADREPVAPVDQARFREVLGRFATGVTVVTAVWEDRPVGLAVNSFTSVSLVPPLVAFCVSKASTTWPRIKSANGFCVNVLSEDQEAMSRVFAQRAPFADRFSGIGWRPAPSGGPVLDGVLAWIDCDLEAEHDGGDHRIVVGRVHHLDVAHDGRPLVFYRGGYGGLES